MNKQLEELNGAEIELRFPNSTLPWIGRINSDDGLLEAVFEDPETQEEIHVPLNAQHRSYILRAF